MTFEAVPGRSLGPFEIGKALPDAFEYEPQPGAAGLPGFVLVKGLPVKLHIETSDKPGIDEIEVAAGLGVGVRLSGVELLGRRVDEVIAGLERIEQPQEDPEDEGSYHARGWSFWAPEGTIEGVVVERPEFFDDPPEL